MGRNAVLIRVVLSCKVLSGVLVLKQSVKDYVLFNEFLTE